MQKAFVLGAGLGTRLKSLTEFLPKPLIPVYHRPLIAFAFEHLRRVGVEEFIVNTHHCADAYTLHFPKSIYRGLPITFRHEPVLLETGGGIANVGDLLADAPFIVYNGDILTDLPLETALAAHKGGGHMVTLVLRSHGPAQHIAWDSASGEVVDIRDKLETGRHTPYQFTGIYLCEPEFLGELRTGEKHSVIPVFLELIKRQALGGVVIDEGNWWDLGNRETYLAAHLDIRDSDFPRYDPNPGLWKNARHPAARIHAMAMIDENSCIGDGALVEQGALVRNSLVWPGARVAMDARLDHCIVRTAQTAVGELEYQNV